MEKNYTTTTLNEYFETKSGSNKIFVLPAKAIKELKTAKNRSDLVSKTLKKYLINSRQAQTNAKIVEALLV